MLKNGHFYNAKKATEVQTNEPHSNKPESQMSHHN